MNPNFFGLSVELLLQSIVLLATYKQKAKMPKLTTGQQIESLIVLSQTPIQCLSRFLVREKKGNPPPALQILTMYERRAICRNSRRRRAKNTYLGGLPGVIPTT